MSYRFYSRGESHYLVSASSFFFFWRISFSIQWDWIMFICWSSDDNSRTNFFLTNVLECFFFSMESRTPSSYPFFFLFAFSADLVILLQDPIWLISISSQYNSSGFTGEFEEAEIEFYHSQCHEPCKLVLLIHIQMASEMDEYKSRWQILPASLKTAKKGIGAIFDGAYQMFKLTAEWSIEWEGICGSTF